MKVATLAAHDARLTRVVAWLRMNRDEPADATALARLAGLSPRQFGRVFVRLFGESPAGCQRRLRLERAARGLRVTRRSILPLALEAGFASHEAFTRSFKRHFGKTPAEFRALPVATLQPGCRPVLWRQAFAAGLRRHVEASGPRH